MADTKLSALTADASPTSDDLVYTVHDPAGTPASRKVTIAALGAAIGAIGGTVGAEDDAIILGDGAGEAKPSILYGSEAAPGFIGIGGKTAAEVGIKHHQGSVIIAQVRTADDSAHASISALRPTYNVSADTIIGSDITAPFAVITNRTNSAALKTITLPASPLNGESYSFINIDADGLAIQAQGSQVIRIGTGVSTAAGSATATDVGARLDLVYIGQGFAWAGLASGTWTLA